jgi:hypothetical protein
MPWSIPLLTLLHLFASFRPCSVSDRSSRPSLTLYLNTCRSWYAFSFFSPQLYPCVLTLRCLLTLSNDPFVSLPNSPSTLRTPSRSRLLSEGSRPPSRRVIPTPGEQTPRPFPKISLRASKMCCRGLLTMPREVERGCLLLFPLSSRLISASYACIRPVLCIDIMLPFLPTWPTVECRGLEHSIQAASLPL